MNHRQRELLSWVLSIVAGVCLALLLRTYLIEPYQILQTSMESTIHETERIYVNKLAYRVGDPQRGDVVLASIPGEERPLIKRVIALPGDTVEVRDGAVWLNGQRLEEPYLDCTTPGSFGPLTVTEDHLFLMGDNRPVSRDSRSSTVGLVAYDQLIGRAELVYWPLTHFRRIDRN